MRPAEETPSTGSATAHMGDSISRPKVGWWAWGVCWLMFASTVLNYLDRQSIALVGPQIKKEFGLGYVDFGWVMAAFSMSYALFQVPAGYLVDRWNVRWVYAGAVAWWSAAAMAAAFSPSLGILMILRAVLGVGEAFNWPCALRVTRTILPPEDRSLGNGIFNSGAAIGAVLAPLVIMPIANAYGWRAAFLVVGAAGFIWIVAWLGLLGGSRTQKFAGEVAGSVGSSGTTGLSATAKKAFAVLLVVSLAILAAVRWHGYLAIWFAIAAFMIGLLIVARVLPPESLEGSGWASSLGAVVRRRRFWLLMVVSVSINVCWHFLLNWLPTYVREDLKPPDWLITGFAAPIAGGFSRLLGRAVDPTSVGTPLLITLPFIAADLGNLLGGTGARWLAGRGFRPVRARLAVMALCTLVISSGALVGRSGNSYAAIYLLSLMAMGTAAFMANYFSFAQEASIRNTGLIVGILGAFGNLLAAGFMPFVGRVREATGGFGLVFLLVGLMPFVGLATLVIGWEAADLPEEGPKVA